jgi:hypothetical protein
VLFTFTVDAPPQKRSEAVQRAAPLELAPPVARPPAPAEVNSQIPLAVPEETESPADDDSGGPERTYENQILRNRGVELRQKDDSHSQPEFVQV